MFTYQERRPELKALFNPDIDAAGYANHLQQITDPNSRFIIENGHFGGLLDLSSDLYFAATVARNTPEPQSSIMDATLSGLCTLEAIAESTQMQYNPLPSYKLANAMFENVALNARTRMHGADFIREHTLREIAQTREILERADYQDDHLPYTVDTTIEALFGVIHGLKVQLPRIQLLLDTCGDHLPRIDRNAHLDLVNIFNCGAAYLLDAGSLSHMDGEESRLVFDNIQHTVCQLYASSDLSPAKRSAIKQLIQATAIDLSTAISRKELSTDEADYLTSFVEYSFLDTFVPGITRDIHNRIEQ